MKLKQGRVEVQISHHPSVNHGQSARATPETGLGLCDLDGEGTGSETKLDLIWLQFCVAGTKTDGGKKRIRRVEVFKVKTGDDSRSERCDVMDHYGFS